MSEDHPETKRRDSTIAVRLRRAPLPALRDAMGFLGHAWWKVIAASLGMLIPCFWHARIAAQDLGSHTYNAWLAQLISEGQAPGLYIAQPWVNVLFDYLLLGMTRALGFVWGEKIAVALCVLVFFWGAFALASVLAGRAAWIVTPLLAMLSYGWVFHAGFFNLYLACGLSLFALALVWRGAGWELLLLVPLVLLVSRAHLLGTVWVLAAGAYLALARFLPRRRHWLLIGFALIAYLSVLGYALSTYPSVPVSPDGAVWLGGADQLLLFDRSYYLIALAVMIAAGSMVAGCFLKHGREAWSAILVPGALYGLLVVAGLTTPGGLRLPEYAASMSLLPDRITLFAALLGCCVLASLPLRRLHAGIFAALALAFFGMLYGDTGKANLVEEKIRALVAPLPSRARVMATLVLQHGGRVGVMHTVDRACIGHCFSYGNYEPGTLQFRVRAAYDNSIVAPTNSASSQVQGGGYLVTAQDLPAWQVYFCGSQVTDVCIQQLQANQFNGVFATAPPPRW